MFMYFTDRFQKAFRLIYLIPLVLVGVIAYFDNIGRRMFLAAPNSGEVYQAMEPLYMTLFHSFVYTVIIGSTLIVYYYRKDIRETLAYLAFSLFSVYSGVWDILYYWIQGQSVPDTLAHLQGTPPGTVAFLLGNEVTRELLYVNAVLFLIAGLVVAGSLRYGSLGGIVSMIEDRIR